MPETVFSSIGVDHPIGPEEPLPPLPMIPRGAVVVASHRPEFREGQVIDVVIPGAP
jgi:hypothetical protein